MSLKPFTRDRRLLTAFGLVLIFCIGSGCRSGGLRSPKWLMGKRSPATQETSEIRSSAEERSNSTSPTEVVQSSATSADENPLDPPPPPLGQISADPNEALVLSVTDAVANALSNNLHLRVVEDLPEEAAARTAMERAHYDTAFNTNAQYLNGTQQVSSALQAVRGGLTQYSTTSYGPVSGAPNLMSLEQRFSTGTTARVGLGPTYNYNAPMGQYLIYNPAYQSAASLVIEQALFRGANRQANLAGIKIAETGQKQSASEFQVEVNQTLFDLSLIHI